jgi:PRTRC genetic system protein C
MSLIANKLPRLFRFKIGSDEKAMEDPNPNLKPDEVMSMCSAQYPELTNATVSGPKIENDQAVYKFETTVGTKG